MSIKNIAFILAVAVLAIFGFLEYDKDKLATELVKPVAVPVAALKTAKTVAANSDKAQMTAMEEASDLIYVALVVNEGHAVPVGAFVGENFGCNDRVGYVGVTRLQNTGNAINDAVVTLLGNHEYNVDEAYNALAGSRLTLERTDIKDNTYEFYLKGEVVSGGTCDDPRLKMQLEATIALRTPQYRIFLNGKESNWRCLGDMSGQCQ